MNLRRSQTSILYIKFPVFLRWRAMHENACKSLHEGTEICCSFSWDVNLQHQSPLGVFLRDKTIFDFFFDRGVWRHVCFHVSPRKGHLSLSSRGKNIMFSGKNTIFPDNTRKMLCQGGPFGKAIFSESLKKISYFRLFFERDHLSFSVQVARSYFQEKEILSFPIIQERSYSSGNFLERPSFQDVWKNKIWFSVQ